MCTALGISIEIPIIIRRLAATLYWQRPTDLPVIFDRDFIVSLDAGSDPDDLSAVTTSYHNQWWTGPLPPKQEHFLDLTTLDACLKYHREVSGIKEILPTSLLKSSYTWSRHVMDGNMSPATIDCERCRLYRGVALSVQDTFQDLQRHTEALAVFQEANADNCQRRAAIAFQLYEAAAAKETPPPLRMMTAKLSKQQRSTKARSQQVAAAAAADLKRLQNGPELKWSWGPSLSRLDVLSAVKPPVTSGRIHSGYATSLPGDEQGSDSDGNDSVGSNPIFSEIGGDNVDIPELESADYPHHFCYPPLRHDYFPPCNPPVFSAAGEQNTYHIPPMPRVVTVAVHG